LHGRASLAPTSEESGVQGPRIPSPRIRGSSGGRMQSSFGKSGRFYFLLPATLSRARHRPRRPQGWVPHESCRWGLPASSWLQILGLWSVLQAVLVVITVPGDRCYWSKVVSPSGRAYFPLFGADVAGAFSSEPRLMGRGGEKGGRMTFLVRGSGGLK